MSQHRIGATAVAAAATGSLATAATGPSAIDPIFAVIEARHQAMWNESTSCSAVCRLEESLPLERATWRFSQSDDDWTPPVGCNDAPEWIEAQQKSERGLRRSI